MRPPESVALPSAAPAGPGAAGDDAKAGLLGREELADYLSAHGLLGDAAHIRIRALGGGVSNLTWLASHGLDRLVIKQALPKLRVAGDWYADPARADTEASALGFAGLATPGRVPRLVLHDSGLHLLVLEAAPEPWAEWKRTLLAGDVDPDVASGLGRILAAWQKAPGAAERFGPAGLGLFDQLRLDPYHRTVAARWPELADTVSGLIAELSRPGRVLVHGDFSPKNVLAGTEPGQLWVLDFEVAHLGHPAFDIAFMCHHLLLKALHRPADHAAYRHAATAFVHAYLAELPDPDWDGEALARHTGCLVLARVDGKSPVEYLDHDQRQAARRLGVELLCGSPSSVDAEAAAAHMFAAAEHAGGVRRLGGDR